MDKGYVLYHNHRKEKGVIYEFLAHCTCAKGIDYQYDGTKCENRKTDYFIPRVDQVFDKEELAKENYKEYIKQKRKKEVS